MLKSRKFPQILVFAQHVTIRCMVFDLVLKQFPTFLSLVNKNIEMTFHS